MPSIRIAIGTSDTLPFAAIWSTPTARGPASFFSLSFPLSGRDLRQLFLRPRAAARNAGQQREQKPSAATKSARYKILTEAGWPHAVSAALPAHEFDFPGETPMNINDKAPDFTLQDENGKEIALKDLRGKTVVLYFYPRADTPG